MLLTLGDVAVHGVDDNGDLGAGHGGCFGGSSSYWGSCRFRGGSRSRSRSRSRSIVILKGIIKLNWSNRRRNSREKGKGLRREI